MLGATTVGVLARIAALTVVYLLVLTSLDPADILVGLALSAAIVLAARRATPGREAASTVSPAQRVLGIPALVVGTAVDMVRASVTVSRYCLGRPPAPGLVSVPMSAPTAGAAAAWGVRVGIAPDSIVVDLDEDAQTMLIHVLDSSDPDAVIDAQLDSYRRYQRRVFG